MDPILAALPASLLKLVEGSLSNDEVSSDEALKELRDPTGRFRQPAGLLPQVWSISSPGTPSKQNPECFSRS